jgi:major membrane immunogen (membrane-anchored lipoprotein)
MHRSLLILLTTALLLLPACGLTQKAGATLDDYKAVAVKLNKLGDKIEAMPGMVEAKITDATARAKAAGLNVDGTEADFIDSVKKNPGKSWSVGLSSLGLTLFGLWQRNAAKRRADALASTVDTIDALPTDKTVTRAELLDEIAKHPRMNAGARLETTAVKSR